jgi:hypothetical protein
VTRLNRGIGMNHSTVYSSVVRVATLIGLILSAGSRAVAVDFPQGLMLHFNFDPREGGGVVTDRTGRNNTGHAFGATWTALGKQAGGYDFTATNNYIQVAHSPSLNSTQATWAAWFKTAKSDALSRYILEKSKEKGYALSVYGDSKDDPKKGRLCLTINGHMCFSDKAVTDNTWHHGAATYDGENLKLYVDGQLQQQVTMWKGGIAANTNELTLGLNRSNPTATEKGQSFEGTIDEVMIFNHALTGAEVNGVIATMKPAFTKDQVARRLVELKELLDRGLILRDFYDRKVKECEVPP